MTVEASDVEICADDGFRLAARLYLAAPAPRHTVVFANATGVAQRYYAAFAGAIAAADAAVVTFDYRNVGASLRTDFRLAKGRLADCGLLDLDAVLAWAIGRWPANPLRLVGHSLGAQILGLARHAGHVRRALCLSGGHGYYAYYGRRAEFLREYWSKTIPDAVRADGYLVGTKNKMADLGAEAALDLARWCLSPHYVIDDAGEPLRPYYSEVSADMLFVVPADDHMSPPLAVEKMSEMYPAARHEIEILEPAALGADIGHFGFFKKDVGGKVWPKYIGWLLS
jgi:predicted alpha/beta hydrolase